MKFLYAIFALEIGLLFWAFADPPMPPVMPSRNPPMPVMTPEGTWSTGDTMFYYVMAVEYQTNGVDEVVREIQYVNITNSIAAYPKMLTIRVKTKDDLLDEWRDSGQEFLMKLGTNDTGFYTAELSIE